MAIKNAGFGINMDTGAQDFLDPPKHRLMSEPRPKEDAKTEIEKAEYACKLCGFKGHPLLYVGEAGKVACPICSTDPRTGRAATRGLWNRIKRALAAFRS